MHTSISAFLNFIDFKCKQASGLKQTVLTFQLIGVTVAHHIIGKNNSTLSEYKIFSVLSFILTESRVVFTYIVTGDCNTNELEGKNCLF